MLLCLWASVSELALYHRLFSDPEVRLFLFYLHHNHRLDSLQVHLQVEVERTGLFQVIASIDPISFGVPILGVCSWSQCSSVDRSLRPVERLERVRQSTALLLLP